MSTGSGRHSDAAHEIRLIGCCILLNVVPKTVPLSGSSWSPLDCLLPFGRLASLEAMRLFFKRPFVTKITGAFVQTVSHVFSAGDLVSWKILAEKRAQKAQPWRIEGRHQPHRVAPISNKETIQKMKKCQEHCCLLKVNPISTL